MRKRLFLAIVICVSAALCQAQSYPAKPIRMVIEGNSILHFSRGGPMPTVWH